jgi:Flp pilus assembly protein CpaB
MKPLRVLDDLRRRVLIHRRLLGALCAAAATWLVVQAATSPPPTTQPVWTAARDLPTGTVLTSDDLHRTGFAPGSIPPAAVHSVGDVLGRTLATPLGAGEPVTPAHLVGAERLAGYPGREAVAVRIPDAGVVSLLAPGQSVALVATDPQGGRPPERIAEDAVVLAVPKPSRDTAPSTLTGRLVVFAVPAGLADGLASAGTTRYLTVVWSR